MSSISHSGDVNFKIVSIFAIINVKCTYNHEAISKEGLLISVDDEGQFINKVTSKRLCHITKDSATLQ